METLFEKSRRGKEFTSTAAMSSDLRYIKIAVLSGDNICDTKSHSIGIFGLSFCVNMFLET